MRPIDVKRLLNLEHVEINEAVLFLNKCKQYGADPFMNDMYMIKYSASATAAIVTGVGFFQKKAAANPRFKGYGKTLWLTKEGKWVDCWVPSLHGKNPMACQASCFIEGYEEKQTFTCNWEENSKNTNPWKTMASRMLEKDAIVGLLRACLPQDLGGLYISEEITGEEAPEATVAPASVKLESISVDLRDPDGGEVFEAESHVTSTVEMGVVKEIEIEPEKMLKVSAERQEIDAAIEKKKAAEAAKPAPERSEATSQMPAFGQEKVEESEIPF
jgi:phage recombination protein Bet